MTPLQVHGLDPDDWKKAEVIHIDIADRTQVGQKVGLGEMQLSALLGVSNTFVGTLALFQGI